MFLGNLGKCEDNTIGYMKMLASIVSMVHSEVPTPLIYANQLATLYINR